MPEWLGILSNKWNSTSCAGVENMKFTRRAKILLAAGIIVVVAVATPLAVLTLLNTSSTPPPIHNIRFTLLDNAGVMIEHDGVRIYIDPYNLPSSYDQLPADAILITHPHFDHYQPESLGLVQQSETVIVFPEDMTEAITVHDGVGVNPGDELYIEHIRIQAFYEYALDGGLYPNHPRENNWTSYIVDVNGFTFFHAGDSANIEEYTQLTETIDVALLPVLIFNSQDVVDALEVIQPNYFIPVHFAGTYHEIFVESYGDQITGCEILLLNYFESKMF